MAYLESRVGWHRAVHLDFAEAHAASGQALNYPFRLMEGTCVVRRRPHRGRNYNIRPPNSEELEQLAKVIHQSRPEPYVKALDLLSSEIDLEQIHQSMAAAGLQRDRKILVASRNDRPIAAAVMEVSEGGLNLFGLLDGVRLFALTKGGIRAFRALLEAAQEWYLEQGKSRFIYFLEVSDRKHVEQMGMKDLGLGQMWIIRSSLVPDFIEHLYIITARNSTPRSQKSIRDDD